MKITYDIEIEGFNSAGIREWAREIGATHMREIGSYGQGDARITAYAMPYGSGEFRCIDTNGDPIGEDDDAFATAMDLIITGEKRA